MRKNMVEYTEEQINQYKNKYKREPSVIFIKEAELRQLYFETTGKPLEEENMIHTFDGITLGVMPNNSMVI